MNEENGGSDTLSTLDEDNKLVLIENIAEYAKWKGIVLGSKTPVVVDFWAPWCGPCDRVVSIVEELSKEYAGRVRFVKVNVDEGRQIAASMDITNIPTFVFFKQGEAINRHIGALTKSALEAIIRESFQDAV